MYALFRRGENLRNVPDFGQQGIVDKMYPFVQAQTSVIGFQG